MPLIAYTLLIDDLPADSVVIDSIDDIEVESHIEIASILRLKLRIQMSADGTRWEIQDDDIFSRLASVRLLVTIGAGIPHVVFDGYVTETEAILNDPDSGASSLTVIAMDATAIMNLKERTHEWPNMSDSLIATQIFAEYGLVPIADLTEPVRVETDSTVIQRDTDIRFLRSLARRNGFDVYADPTPVPGVVEGHFHAPRLEFPPQGILSVSMAGVTNVEGFVVKNEMLRPFSVSAQGVDAGTIESQHVSTSVTSLDELGDRSLHSDTQPRTSFLRPDGLSRTGELLSAVQAAVDRSSWAVTVTCQVDSYQYGDVIRAGSTILVRGAGRDANGTYFVERVLHSFYGRRSFLLHPESDPETERAGAHRRRGVHRGPRATGMKNTFYGKYRGIVSDNADPLMQARIKAEVPAVLGDVVTGWALPCLPYTGDGAGLHMVPEPGAGVWIEFEGGNPSYPIWTGGWFGTDQAPEREKPGATRPPLKILRSEKGLIFALDDDDQTITLSDANGNNLLTIKTTEGQIRIQAVAKTIVESPLIELVENATHPVAFGDLLLQYLNQLVMIFNTHLHVGELAAGIIPVTPAPPATPFPPAQPTLISTRVTSG